MKKKVLVDLDVITVAVWKKRDLRRAKAIKFINEVKNKEFKVFVPFILIERVLKWKNTKLVEAVKEFYIDCANILSDTDVGKKFGEVKKIEYVKDELLQLGIKEEDILLILVTSIFKLDHLVTFNRKHLINNEEVINRVLSKYGLKEIDITLPEKI